MSERSVYVTYLRGTREKLWQTLKRPEFIRAYGFGCFSDCDPGECSEIFEIDPPRLLVMRWRNAAQQGRNETYSRAAFALEQDGGTVKLTVTHTIEQQCVPLIEAAVCGWPGVLSRLKRFLETGQRLGETGA